MKTRIIITGGALLAFTGAAHAFDNRDASKKVQQFSELVACQLPSPSEYPPLQYESVQLAGGASERDTFGSVWVVHWNGDLGCSGGNGASLPHFTVVEHSGFGSVEPVIHIEYDMPDLELVTLTKISADDEVLHLEGIAYGPDDRQHQPSMKVSYDLKLGYDGFELVSD